jgi:chorismate synthase
MQQALTQAIGEKDSLGGIVEAIAFNVPVGWGDPVYEKLEANLAKAMLSLPASKGFEIGEGYAAAHMRGSQHNDLFCTENETIKLSSNHAGGTLGGISNGMPIVIRVPFKPTSSIGKSQPTIDFQNQANVISLPEGSRHDPCVAIRAVPVVEAMFALVLADAMLMNRNACLKEHEV